MELQQTPALPQFIDAYGDGGFRISGKRYEGSVLILPANTLGWPVSAMSELSPESLAPVVGAVPAVELLIIGCGRQLVRISEDLRQFLKQAGIVVEPMDTGAACRTFNVLQGEQRRIAAALIALP